MDKAYKDTAKACKDTIARDSGVDTFSEEVALVHNKIVESLGFLLRVGYEVHKR